MLKIRQLLKSEIGLLQNFPPKEWNLDLPEFVSFHFGYPYFLPIVTEIENKIAGFGNGILNGKAGWIGNIIVLPEYRNRGIGYELTNFLVEYFKSKGCKQQLLIASDMGKNIYTKIGFKISSTYQFFKVGTMFPNYPKVSRIRKIKEGDFTSLKKLDKEATGEERFHLIERFFSTGWVYSHEESGEIRGIYLPDLGSGLVIAKDPEAGLELLKFRLSQGKTNAVLPSENEAAINLLKHEGYQPYQTLPRMVLGDEVKWKPEYIFNRASGYCG
jgi:GNAT superfamily N-acetyltransferase